MHEHTLFIRFWGSKRGLFTCWSSALPTELHLQPKSCFLMYFRYIDKLMQWMLDPLLSEAGVPCCFLSVWCLPRVIYLYSGKCYGFGCYWPRNRITKDFKVMCNVLWNQVEEAQFPAKINGFWYKRSVELRPLMWLWSSWRELGQADMGVGQEWALAGDNDGLQLTDFYLMEAQGVSTLSTPINYHTANWSTKHHHGSCCFYYGLEKICNRYVQRDGWMDELMDISFQLT